MESSSGSYNRRPAVNLRGDPPPRRSSGRRTPRSCLPTGCPKTLHQSSNHDQGLSTGDILPTRPGWTSTPFAGGGRGKGADHSTANTIPTNLMMMKGARVIGCPVAIHTRLQPSIRAPRVKMIEDLVDKGLIKPHVSHEFPLSEVKEALLAKWNRQVVGGCVVRCSGE